MSFLASIFGQTSSVADNSGWFVRAVGFGKTKAGTVVSEHNARNQPVVYACVNRIANPIARFPLKMFKRDKDGGSKEVTSEQHPLARGLAMRPNEFMSSRTLRKTVQGHALLWGNGYVEIERNQRGQSVGLWPLLPDRTRPVREGNAFFYRTNIAGETFDIDSGNVIHVMDQSHDGYVGQSPIWHARNALGLAFAMEEFGSKFFANDAKSGGFLQHPGRLGTEARANLKKAPEERTDAGASLERQGGLDNAHRVKILEEGMKFVSTTIPQDDAQFLGSREFQIAEIARIFDVPLVLLQSHEKSTSWGSGIEQLMIGFVRQTIDPWVDAWEQELNWKLFTEEERSEGFFVKFNMNAILRGDMAARAAFYGGLFQVGAISPNQVLALEDFEGIGPDGDHHFVPAAMTPLDRAINPPEPPPQLPSPPKEPA
ncbi:phage portal protein, HK97 family [Kaistia soli DSM 19436]|uniref:Phage portal protein, HK97 family n=1 Tax=Kaistia soli DSM 19436 TaxID=1122133 RepID=A0A1M4Y927_9HYPH|nr:phage portal protein [Kaistia soli]SHF02150.1 phage portal protein, HK97 family [Kaistia soli DSM 19436]